MKKYEVWLEGYRENECNYKTQYLGTFEGESFKKVCKYSIISSGYELFYYNEEKNTYWKCRFFSNFKDAVNSGHGIIIEGRNLPESLERIL